MCRRSLAARLRSMVCSGGIDGMATSCPEMVCVWMCMEYVVYGECFLIVVRPPSPLHAVSTGLLVDNNVPLTTPPRRAAW